MALLGDQTENDHVDVALFFCSSSLFPLHTLQLFTHRETRAIVLVRLIFQFSLHHCQQQRERKQQ